MNTALALVQRLLRGRRRALLVPAFLAAAFVLFAVSYERGRTVQRQTAAARHARELGAPLWNFDHATAADYLGVAAELENYERVIVRDSRGEAFLTVAGPAEGPLDRALHRLGLIPVRAVAHPVTYRGQIIGEFRARARDRAVYAYAYLLALLLFMQVALTAWLRTLGAKRDLEEHVLAQTADLMRLNEELRQKNEELKALDELKTNLLANVSHELRTPLVAVRGYTELIADGQSGPVTDRQQQQLLLSLRSIDRLTRLIDDLLQYSLMERGNMAFRLQLCDLGELARDAAEQARHLAEHRQLQLVTAVPPALLPVTGDPARLTQVMANLLDNAIKFTPAGGTVTLTAGAEAQNVYVRVSDTGIGIPADKLDKVFERFYQVQASYTRSYGGTGIGLALCREIVRAHHGTITAASESGRGTTIAVLLPRAAPESCLPA